MNGYRNVTVNLSGQILNESGMFRLINLLLILPMVCQICGILAKFGHNTGLHR
uniref:Uncharacterized protein n=1 Tax=Anguilla anguilla TaxID=7936 RepID=A0A0E9QKA2_ANGAN